jgi:MoxR-like ATPase
MGKDEHGNPAKNPGFFLLASQNPASYQGRIEEDPALRRRLFKIQADWTPEQLLVSKQNDARILSTGPHFFAQNNNNDLLRMPSSPGGRCPTGRMEGLK